MRSLSCGCRTCGCICAEHSDTGEPQHCAPHTVKIVAAFVGAEAVHLVAVSIFVGSLIILAAAIG